MDSAGTAQAEQEKWADSVEAKMNRISAVFESISSNMLSSETFKNTLDVINRILDGIDALTKSGMTAIPIFTSLASIMGGMGNGLFSFQNMNNAKALISAYNNSLALSTEEQIKFNNSLAQTNPRFAAYANDLNGAKANLSDYNSYLGKTALSTAALTVKTVALNVAINAGIGLIISLIATGLSKWINHQRELNQALEDSTTQINNNLESFDGYKKQIDNIVESEIDETEKIKQLSDVKDTLSKKYRTELDDIKDVTKAREYLNDVIDKESEKELKNYYLKNKKAFQNSVKTMDQIMNVGVYGFDPTGKNHVDALKSSMNYADFGNANIGKDIQDLFDTFEFKEGTKGSFDLSFNINGKTPEEYYFNLQNVLSKIDAIKDTSIDGLTKDEEAVYNIVKSRFEHLDEILNNKKVMASLETFKESLEPMARYYTEVAFPQGNMDLDTWKRVLFELQDVKNNVYLKDVIEDLVDAKNKVEDLSDASDESVSPLAELYASLQKVDEGCKSISKEIEEADKAFDKLNKTLEDNKDVDKFFSASDIIEILELYPELNDAILETAYGYKIEESAIQELHDTKLAEKKADIQNKLDETQTLLDATTKKLSYYQNELKGIENVAKAKAKLVELEAKYASLGSNTTNPYYNNGALESEIAMLNDFINLSEESERLQKDIDKLSIENKVLGNSFDKAKDATENQTKALNDQKKAIDELKDGYDDAKKAIEDLIELTMAMLKKNAELEKEALKEELEGFKKLIDKRKELIDLEKQQYDFEKDLKEQNKDLLKIQQELDALSVEGVNYSLEDLKRKAELEEKVAEQKSKRDDFLYDHEVDVRKDALDKEQELFEDQINTQIKSIEDYLDHEGKIRAEAVDLINGKSQQFYDNLLDYTMNYTKKSRYEFDKLWQDAYDAILKYANGELNVEMALINIINAMELAENQLKSIDAALNNIKNSTDDAKKAMYDFLQVTSDTKAKLDEINNMPTKSAINYSTDPRFSDPEYAKLLTKQAILGGKNGKNAMDLIKQIRGYHTGGIVEGVSTQHGEVLAKLLSGEVVVTEKQARNFMENTLPKLATNTTTNNQSIAPVINIGDININGNADKDTVSQLNAVRQSIVDDVFKAVNRQNSTFNGMRPRFV